MILGDKYIELNDYWGFNQIYLCGVNKFYETEHFFALPLEFTGIKELLLIKKEEINCDKVKEKLKALVEAIEKYNEQTSN